MKAHIGADVASGLVDAVVGTATNVNDVTQASRLVHGEDAMCSRTRGDQGRPNAKETQAIKARRNVAMRPGKRRAPETTGARARYPIKSNLSRPAYERTSGTRFGSSAPIGRVKVRYMGLAKNTAQLHTLVALSDPQMARRRLLSGPRQCVRPR